jgi:hypothetical protein
MKRILIFSLFIFLQSSDLVAQVDPQDLIDHSFFNIVLVNNSPYGNYRNGLKNDFVKSSSTGLALSYFFNPLYNSSLNNKVFIGAEVGFSNRQQSNFRNYPPEGDFYMGHNEMWTNFSVRYRPQTLISKFNPYMEAFLGPRFYNSKMMERFGDDELKKIEGFFSSTLNYGLNLGCGYKISKNSHSATYFDVSVGLLQGNGVKLINRNIVGLDDDYIVIAAKTVLKPQNVMVKVGITKYLPGH